MKDLREQIANIVWERLASNCGENPETAVDAFLASDTILALIPKPTVRVKCDECGGKGEIPVKGWEPIPCTCTDGWNEHSINWEIQRDVGAQLPSGEWATEPESKVLTLPDLMDKDIACAYSVFYGEPTPIPNNKGTLRIGEKV